VQIEKEDFQSRSVSANVLLDYELTKKIRIFARGIFANTNRDEVNRHLEYEWDDGTFVSLDEDSAEVEGMSLFKGIEERRNERKTREATLGLQFKGDDWRWEFQTKYDSSDSQYPHRWDSFFMADDIDAAYSNATGDYPIFSLLNGSETKAEDPNEFTFEEVRVIKSHDLFVDTIASFDIERFFTHEKGSLKLKSGLKLLNRDLDSKDEILIYDETAEPLTIGQFLSPWRNDDLHEGNYSLSGFHDPVAFREYFQLHPEDFTLDETRTRSQSDPANYTVNETISSAYVMGDYVWDGWRILAGVRMEKTEDEFTGKEVLFDESGDYQQTVDTEGGRIYTNYFPGVQAVYSANDQLTLYTSWSKAVERPRYYYLAPFRRIVQRSQYIRAGNPDLKPTVFTSLLAAADWAYDDSGFVSLELLRRNNEDIVVESQTVVTEGQFKDYDLYTWDNAGVGIHNQVQVVWNQDLDPLWYELDGFSLEMRYRYNDTETDVRGLEFDPMPIALIPEKDIRTSFVYQNQSWLLRFRADHRSEMLRRIGATPEKDSYYFDKTDYTLTIEYRAGSGWTGNLGIYNLTHEDPEMYFGDPLRPSDLASRGRYWRGSVRYTF
jgi:TonB-dependent receptor